MTIKKIARDCAIFLVFVLFDISFAQEFYNAKEIIKSDRELSLKPIRLQDLLARIPKGSIVVMGEQHNSKAIQSGQMFFLNKLREKGYSISIGMEFLRYPDQVLVNQYRKKMISEEDFKTNAWGDSNFEFYKDQLLFPRQDQNEFTYAINSPKFLPIAVKTKGLENLTQEERQTLPPEFQLGQESYKERFLNLMQYHVPEAEKIQKYFEAQSVWDDTMAWRICETAIHSENTYAVIVGEFHVEYGDGLIHRIQSRCGKTKQIISIIQYLFYDDEIVDLKSFLPSEKYGPISDYLMIVHEQ